MYQISYLCELAMSELMKKASEVTFCNIFLTKHKISAREEVKSI